MFAKRRAGAIVLVGESAGLGRVTVQESWTERGPAPLGCQVSAEGLAALDTLIRSFAGWLILVAVHGIILCDECTQERSRTTSRKIYCYRCVGSDNYRFEGGRVCHNEPVRADYLDQVVWDHITGLLADPALIRAVFDQMLRAQAAGVNCYFERHLQDDQDLLAGGAGVQGSTI